MEQIWELHRISTPERIVSKIRNELPQPAGVIVYGVDCDFKRNTVQKFILGLDHPIALYGMPGAAELAELTRQQHSIIMVPNSETAAQASWRHMLISLIRSLGFKTIVGVYAQPGKQRLWQPLPTMKRIRFNQQLAAIERSKPAMDDLDYFVTVQPKINQKSPRSKNGTN